MIKTTRVIKLRTILNLVPGQAAYPAFSKDGKSLYCYIESDLKGLVHDTLPSGPAAKGLRPAKVYAAYPLPALVQEIAAHNTKVIAGILKNAKRNRAVFAEAALSGEN